MAETAQSHTRHKEYSLVAAVPAGALLLWLNTVSGVLPLVALNAVSIAAILGSAFSVVRHADVLAHRFGEPFGSLILSLAIVTLEVGLISILMLSGAAGPALMRDTIYSVIMIVMAGFIGFALLLGGGKYKTQYFNFSGIKHYLISIIPLSLIVLALPRVMGKETLGSGQLLTTACVCLGIYLFFLRIQTYTHRNFFLHEDEDEDNGHGKPSAHSSTWHFLLLGVHLLAVIGLTKLNSGPLYRLLDMLNAPPAFSGFLVALLILSPEGTGAFRSVLRNQVQRAMNLFLGSVLATISVTVPAVALISVVTGQPLVMGLEPPDILLMLATFLVCQTSLTGGKTNAHSGAAHVALFVAYVMLLFE